MPDVKVAVGRFLTPTSTGNVDWTTADLGGKTPKAVMNIMFKSTANATARVPMLANIGFSDGTIDVSCHAVRLDAQTTTTNRKMQSSTYSIKTLGDNTSTTVDDLEAAVDSFITNGVRYNFTQVDNEAILTNTILFAGDDLQVKVGKATLGVANAEIDVNTIGFQPDIVFFITADDSSEDSRINTDGSLCFGVANPTVSRSFYSKTYAGLSTSEVAAIISTSRVASADLGAIDSVTYTVEATNFDSNGFSLFARDFTASGKLVYYMALNFGGLSSWIGSFDSPTSIGDFSKTGLGFQPQFVGLVTSMLQAEDSYVTTGDAGTMGVSIFTADAEFSGCHAYEDAVTTTNAQSLSDDTAIHLTDDAGTQTHLASFSSMDADGFTLNFSATDGIARKGFGWAIEDPETADGIENPYNHLHLGQIYIGL